MSQHPTMFGVDANGRRWSKRDAILDAGIGLPETSTWPHDAEAADETISALRRANAASGSTISSSGEEKRARQYTQRKDEMLQAMFESSDDLPTSDDHLEAVPWSNSSSSEAEMRFDLNCFDRRHPPTYMEPDSPTAGRQRKAVNKLTPGRTPSVAGKKRSAYSRSSSVNDPFGAFGSAAASHGSPSYNLPTRDCRPPHYHQQQTGSPRSAPPPSQRRRLGPPNGKRRFERTGTSVTLRAALGHQSLNGAAGGTSSDSEDPQSDGRDTPEGFSTDDLAGDHSSLGSSQELDIVDDASSSTSHDARVCSKGVEKVWDKGETVLDLSNSELKSIHPVIADLANYVAIDPPRSSSGNAAKIDQGQLQLYLQNNSLTRLPSAFFALSKNLRVLSLRSNHLKCLPAAIGTLHSLRELNIANNELKVLPAEMQNLELEQFRYFPNPFLQPAKGLKLKLKSRNSGNGSLAGSMASCFGALETHSSGGIPSLRELCIRRLLSPYEGDDEGDSNEGEDHRALNTLTLIQSYENGALRELDCDAQMEGSTISLLESARRSIEGKWGSVGGTRPSREAPWMTASTQLSDSWCKGVSGRGENEDGISCNDSPWNKKIRRPEVSSLLDSQGDDSDVNPYFNRCLCGGPKSRDETVSSIYSRPVESRVEWVSHIGGVYVTHETSSVESLEGAEAVGSGVLPIIWRGCSVGCLSFLER